MGLPKRKLIFQPSIFRCYVSFRDKKQLKKLSHGTGNVGHFFRVFWCWNFYCSSAVFWKSICLVLNEQLSHWRIWIHNESRTWWSSKWEWSSLWETDFNNKFSVMFFFFKDRSAPKGSRFLQERVEVFTILLEVSIYTCNAVDERNPASPQMYKTS